MKCCLQDIKEHGYTSEKVFSIDSVAITVRNFAIPFAMNGMLVHDDRLGWNGVRRLLGDELCRISEVEKEDVQWLR